MTGHFAVISDVNGNAEALEAVIDDISAHHISDILFLGDAVGYGPCPVECALRVRGVSRMYIRGRIESQITISPSDPMASTTESRMLEFTRVALNGAPELLEWLRSRPLKVSGEGLVAVHSNPLGESRKCLMFGDVSSDTNCRSGLFGAFERLLFVGDNHDSWVICEDGRASRARSIGYEFMIPRTAKCVVSVGSVGQPRDGEWRSRYVIIDDDHITWRCVEYDVEAVGAKIRATPLLDWRYAERLKDGV